MKVFYSAQYQVSLPGHIWPTSKYRLIAGRLGLPRRDIGAAFVEPAPATWKDLALVHTPDYLTKLRTQTLTPEEIATLELPWAPGMADMFRLMAGGTCGAAAAALEDGAAAHLGGGLHHAFANHGEGFCPVNDVAIAIRALQRDHAHPPRGNRRLRRASRKRHGDDLRARRPHLHVFDSPAVELPVLQAAERPRRRPRGRRRRRAVLDALAGALPRVFASRPEVVIYLAGADPFERDRLGGLKVTKAGLAARDRLVFDTARAEGVAIATVLAGGYAEDVNDTVDIHVATIEAMMVA